MSAGTDMSAKDADTTLDKTAHGGCCLPSWSSSSILKRRMQLKRMEIRIEEAVSWNLGYCPSDIWFDELLDKRNDLSLIVSKTDLEWWAIYDRFKDADNCKRLMVFLSTND